MNLSIAIIARDEARHIGAALASVAGLTDQVRVLLDQRTTDATATIAESYGALVSLEPWRGFAAQHNHALQICDGTWVLFIDGDERVTPELAEQIRAIVNNPADPHAGYWIPRQNIFFGTIVRGGGWYPDHQLRLMRRTQARYDETRLVHEYAEVTGPTGYLTGHLLHLNIERFDEFWQKQRAYAAHEARILHQSGRRVRLRNLVGAPAREFVRRFITLGGWRDGGLGLLLCGTLAYFELIKYARVRKLQQSTP